MEIEFYICEFCRTAFKPARRKVQRFCSDTCRSKNHHHKNNAIKPPLNVPSIQNIETEVMESTILAPDKLKVEKMSVAGIGNAAAGNLLADGVKAIAKNIFGSAENDPATKGDIQELKNLINTRYFKINNMDTRYDGAQPYFDKSSGTIVYLGDPFSKFKNQILP